MDDGRGPGVQEVQPPEYLPPPAPHHLGSQLLQPFHVTVVMVGSDGE